MSYLPEMIAAILLLVLLIYFLNNLPKYKEKKRQFLIRFRQVRKRSLNLQNAFTQYIIEHDAIKTVFKDGMTYGQFLNQLKKNHISNLSEKNFAKLKSTNNRLVIKKREQMLDEQEAWFDEVEKEFNSLKK